MTDEITQNIPVHYKEIFKATEEAGFTMASDIQTCSLLRTLASTKPNGELLELGTGSGLSTSWILDGMNNNASLISVDNDESFLNIAKKYLSLDKRLSLIKKDGEIWIKENLSKKFDFIFADTWPGKYNHLEEIITMLKPGGIYIIDDMSPQSNWPVGHDSKAAELIEILSAREDIALTKQVWATGIIITVKK
jgi:predicted O-methyltransferase YrrM